MLKFFSSLPIFLYILAHVRSIVYENIMKNGKPIGETYGSRIQRLEDSIVYKINHPSNSNWKSIIEDMKTCANITNNFFMRLRLDDQEEIKFALQFVQNGVPQIITRNYTQIKLSKMFNITSYEVTKLYNSIMEYADAWKYLRDPYFEDIYYNKGIYKSLFMRFKFERKLPKFMFPRY